MFPAYARRLVTRLLHLYPILSSMGTSGSWLCLWRLITPSHLLKRSRPSWLIHLHFVAAATTAAPAKVEAKEESEESDEDMGFVLFD